MCLSNVYENSVEQKNLILSNVQRIDCKDGFVVLVDLFERETRVEGRPIKRYPDSTCLLSITAPAISFFLSASLP